MYSEAQLISRITSAVPSGISGRDGRAFRHGLQIGVGDDAAVISRNTKTDLVLSCDAFLEGIHFVRTSPADSIGYKSLARAVSDLAAMGAAPAFFLLTIALPENRTGEWLDQFLRGMAKAARQLKILLIGGDVTKSQMVSISITVIGEASKGRAVTRSGAGVGDLIYVSGRLGRAQLGLELMQHGLGGLARYKSLLKPHLFPQIRVKLGYWLARTRVASAMMDLSDGLSSDMSRLCKASKVGARLFDNRIPCVQIPPDLSNPPARLSFDPLRMALHGGEDYELLFTVPPKKVKLLKKAPSFSDLTAIGEITRENQVVLASADGRNKPLKPQGWDPFRSSK